MAKCKGPRFDLWAWPAAVQCQTGSPHSFVQAKEHQAKEKGVTFEVSRRACRVQSRQCCIDIKPLWLAWRGRFVHPCFRNPCFRNPCLRHPWLWKSLSRGKSQCGVFPTFGILAFGIPDFGIPDFGIPGFGIPNFLCFETTF